MKELLLFACFLPCWLFAQSESTLDSLQKIVSQKRIAHDKLGEAEALFAIGNIYYDKQEDQLALEHIDAALQVLPAGNPILLGRLLYRKGKLLHFMKPDNKQMMPLLDSAYLLLKASNDPGLLAPFLQTYGGLLNQQLHYDKGQKILLEAEQLCLQNSKIGTTDRLLNIYSNLVAGAFASGDFNAALSFSRKGLELGKNSENYELLADLYYNNALVLATLHYEKDAERFYLKALELNKKAGVATGVVAASLALGSYYCNINEVISGFRYLNQAKATATQIQDLYSVAVAYQMESGAYFTLKNYPMALLKIDSCIQYFEQSKNPRFLQGVFHDKSLPLIAMNRYDEAEFWAKKELELAKTSNSNYHAYKAYLQLSEIEQGRHNFEKALNYFKLYSTLKDTVFNQNLQAKLAEEHTRQNIDAEHEARRKAELQSKVLKTTNQLYATVAASLLLMLLLGGYLFTKLQKTRKLLEVQNIHLNLLNQTKDKFFGIIAHDLRNPLSSFMGTSEQLTYYLEKGDVEKVKIAGDLISKSAANLNGLLDNLLSWALLNRGLISINPQALSLAAESSAVIEIQENALAAKNITLENRIPDGLKAMADSNAFQTILRNLIGNAVKFTPKNGLITIDAEQNKENVLIRIQDTGMGMSEEKLAQLFTLDKRSERGTAGEKGTNLGLIICKELVELHNGALRATSKEGEGSSFEFSLPKIITS